MKVVAGSCDKASLAMKNIYEKIIAAGLYLAETIEICTSGRGN